MTDTRDTIVQLLGSIGSRREVDEYLSRYAAADSSRFAIVRVSGALLRDDLEGIAASLAFLQRVGLTPVVLHGAGPQIEAELRREPDRGNSPAPVAVSADVLEVVRRVVQRENLALVAALEGVGARARPLLSGVFRATQDPAGPRGLVADACVVAREPLEAAVAAGQIPVLGGLGETAQGQIVSLSPVGATCALARALQPDKVVFLRAEGGLLSAPAALLPSVNLAEDGAALDRSDALDAPSRALLREIRQILAELPDTSSVSVTSPAHLARELFTHSGSGTLVRQGERIQRYEGARGWEHDRVQSLLESCFGRPLVPGYFATKPFHRVYISDSYRSTAILTQEGGLEYLDKFGVTQKAQGEGLGRSTWIRMRRDNPRLFWRSRADNPINGWYFGQSDGSWRQGEWVVFWYGLDDFELVRRAITVALSLPPTLAAHGVSAQ